MWTVVAMMKSGYFVLFWRVIWIGFGKFVRTSKGYTCKRIVLSCWGGFQFGR